MIQSLDGKKIKRGEICYTLGITVGGIYTPCRCKAHSISADYFVPDESRVYSTFDACQKVCDEKNNKNKK